MRRVVGNTANIGIRPIAINGSTTRVGPNGTKYCWPKENDLAGPIPADANKRGWVGKLHGKHQYYNQKNDESVGVSG